MSGASGSTSKLSKPTSGNAADGPSLSLAADGMFRAKARLWAPPSRLSHQSERSEWQLFDCLRRLTPSVRTWHTPCRSRCLRCMANVAPVASAPCGTKHVCSESWATESTAESHRSMLESRTLLRPGSKSPLMNTTAALLGQLVARTRRTAPRAQQGCEGEPRDGSAVTTECCQQAGGKLPSMIIS